MYHNYGGSKLNPATHSQPLQVTYQGCQKHGHYTVRNTKHATLTSTSSQISPSFKSLQIPASAAYLNSQLRADSPLWPVSLVIVSADHRYNAGGLMPLPKK